MTQLSLGSCASSHCWLQSMMSPLCSMPSPWHTEHNSRYIPYLEIICSSSVLHTHRPLPSQQSSPTHCRLQPAHQCELSVLDTAVEQYLIGGIALSMCSLYSSAPRRYLNFCHQFGLRYMLPLDETMLCCFAAFLGQQKLKHRTVKVILIRLTICSDSQRSQ